MSEFSDTLHIRINETEVCVGQLLQWGFSGYVFPGTRGWQTVVPYGGPEGLCFYQDRMGELSAILQVPVILHRCNDFGWEFFVWLPDGRSTFFQSMTPEAAEDALSFDKRESLGAADELASSDAASLDEDILAEVAPVEQVRPLLIPLLDDFTRPSDPASMFAEAVGLPEYRWLSPHYVTNDPEEARRRGGQEIGFHPRQTQNALILPDATQLH